MIISKHKEKQLQKQKVNRSNHKLYFLLFMLTMYIAILGWKQCNSKSKQNGESLQLKINYVWLGDKKLDLFFQRKFDFIKYPYCILGNDQWEKLGTAFHRFDLMIVQKADILRLLYLYEYGGIYIDLDTSLDYTCLMKLLANVQGFWMAGEPWNSVFPSASNWFLYSSHKKNKKIQIILKHIESYIQGLSVEELRKFENVLQLAGPRRLFRQGVSVLNSIYKCTDHIGIGSWWPKQEEDKL